MISYLFSSGEDDEEEVSLEISTNDSNANEDNSVNMVSNQALIDQQYSCSTNDDEKIALSPLIHEVSPNFGHIHLDWDHSSDLSTPLYDIDDETYRLAQSVAEWVGSRGSVHGSPVHGAQQEQSRIAKLENLIKNRL